jgi:hypothetical protein
VRDIARFTLGVNGLLVRYANASRERLPSLSRKSWTTFPSRFCPHWQWFDCPVDHIDAPPNEPRFVSDQVISEMRGAREITVVIVIVSEIVLSIMQATSIDLLHFVPAPTIADHVLHVANWVAFIAFAAIAFRLFSYRWLRIAAACLAYILFPLVALVVFNGLFMLLNSRVLLIDSVFALPAIMVAVAHLTRLGIAVFIYFLSARRDDHRNSPAVSG